MAVDKSSAFIVVVARRPIAPLYVLKFGLLKNLFVPKTFVQKFKTWAENPHFGKKIRGNIKYFEHSKFSLSEICSICWKIVISCPAYFSYHTTPLNTSAHICSFEQQIVTC